MRWLVVAFVAAARCWAQDVVSPSSAFEPPRAKEAASLVASAKTVPANLLTTGEKSDWNETAPYQEAVDIAHRIERISPLVKTVTFGTTPEGRPMIALIVSKDRAFTPAAAARTDKAVILIQSGIHSGEIEGKDTALMLVRDMVITKRFAKWLDGAIFVVIPVFNVDGHERFSPYHRINQNGPRSMGTRATAQEVNLNRDYMKGDTPEMRAWLRLYNAWLPDFMFDNHVTDGSDMQYDLTWDMARNQDLAEPSRGWVRQTFLPELERRMQADGHMVAPYGALRTQPNGRREFFMEVFSPRYSHLYTAVQNRPCLLVETHSLKAAKTRAWANYDVMRDSIETILLDPQALRKAVREADRQMSEHAGDRTAPAVYLGGKVSEEARPYVYRALKIENYKSEITGAMVPKYLSEPDDIDTVIHDRIDTTAEAQMPLGYLIPAAWSGLADELALHGVQMKKTSKPIEGEFETYRFSQAKFAATSFEGRVMLDFKATLVTEKCALPAGSYWVSMKQRRARLILALLEPDAPDSLAHWGFLDAIFEPKDGAAPYIMEPIAQRMMAASPELKAQFEQRIASDSKFAADPRARLMWWYRQSKYEDADSGLYPVLRVWETSAKGGF
jgi:murein tripeptide amidase MpaA